MDAQLEKIKRRLGITDDAQDLLIGDLIEDAENHFKIITGAETVESKYDFIIRGVVLILYNRKGSEAMTAETVDGYSVQYRNLKDAFEEYWGILDRDFDLSNQRKTGKVKFL